MPNIELLEKVARDCGQLALRAKEQGMEATDKDEKLGAHYATSADVQSQALGLKIIRERFPNEVIIAEEDENKAFVPEDCTVFDSLDGTAVYFNRGTDWGVTLCTLRHGRPDLGVMYFPCDDVLISAQRGSGCWQGGYGVGTRISIPAWHGKLDKIMVGVDVGPWNVLEVFHPIRRRHNVTSRMAAIMGARLVLEGQTAFYFNFNIAKIWDAAAGVLAIEEAGGCAVGPWGQPLMWNTVAADWVAARDRQLLDYAVSYTKKWPGRQKGE